MDRLQKRESKLKRTEINDFNWAWDVAKKPFAKQVAVQLEILFAEINWQNTGSSTKEKKLSTWVPYSKRILEASRLRDTILRHARQWEVGWPVTLSASHIAPSAFRVVPIDYWWTGNVQREVWTSTSSLGHSNNNITLFAKLAWEYEIATMNNSKWHE